MTSTTKWKNKDIAEFAIKVRAFLDMRFGDGSGQDLQIDLAYKEIMGAVDTFLGAVLKAQSNELVSKIEEMINNPKKYTWVSTEGISLIKEISEDIKALVKEKV